MFIFFGEIDFKVVAVGDVEIVVGKIALEEVTKIALGNEIAFSEIVVRRRPR